MNDNKEINAAISAMRSLTIEQITEQLNQIDAERDALRVLLRSARARDRAKKHRQNRQDHLIKDVAKKVGDDKKS